MKVFINKKLLFVLIYLFFVFVTTTSLIISYFDKLTPKINELIYRKLEKVTYDIITDKIHNKIVNDNNLFDLIEIDKNNEGEILYVDFNLDKAYIVNNKINESIRNSINNLDNGTFVNTEFKKGDDSIYINVPLFISSDNVILANLGPKIPIKISFVGTLVTNLKTNIRSYGINNVLNEMFVTIKISELISTPITRDKIDLEYDILIASFMINGRVPTIYGDDIVKEDNILDIPIN